MRKHFLILMLLSLLPLAGWAQIDLSKATAGAAARTYGSTAALTVEVRLDGTVAAGNYTVDPNFYTTDALNEVVKVGDPAVNATKETLPAGTWYIKITGVEDNGYTGTKAIELVVKKTPLSVQLNGGVALHTVYGTPYTVTGPIAIAAADPSQLKNGEAFNDVVSGSITAVHYEGTDATKKVDGTDFGTPRAAYTVTFDGLTSANYELSSAGAMDIWQKKITNDLGTALADGIAISSTGNTVTYKKAAQAPVFTVSLNGTPLSADDFAANFEAVTAGDNQNVGNAVFTVQAKADGNFSGNYTGTADNNDEATYKLTINKAAAIVKANKISRDYDGTETKTDADLATGYTWTGLFGGDVLADPSGAHVNQNAKNAGNYSIVLTANAAWDASNYTVGLDNSGVYEIKKLPLTITADNKTVAYGEAAPTLTATIVGALNTTEKGKLAKGVSAKFIDGFVYAEKDKGVYANVIEPVVDASKDAAFANYTWEALNKGNLTIGAAQILIALKPATKVYGAADPDDLSSSFTVAGATSGLLTPPTVTRVEGEDVGEYLLSFATEATAKPGYDILYTSTPVNFTITKAPLTITALTQIMGKKADVATATAALDQAAVSITGLTNGDTKANISYSLNVKGATTVGVTSTYDDAIEITAADAVDGFKNKNYTITKVVGDLVISEAGDLATIELPADETLMDILTFNNGANINAKVEFDRDQTLGGARTWAAETWNTLVLPFDIKIADLSKALGYAIVNVVDPANTTEKNVVFKLKMSGKIDANTPFLVKTEDAINDVVDANGFITFENVTIKKPASAYPSIEADNKGLGYKFVGAYETKKIDKTLSYLRFLLGNSAKWAYIKSTSDASWNIVPFAAYVDLGEANVTNAPEVIFTMEELDGTTTSIRSIDAEAINENKAVAKGIYNLNGMKMNNVPTQKGVYIINGKKVVVK